MTAVATAIITTGVLNYSSASDATDQAAADNAAADALGRDQLAFNREIFDRDNERYDRDYSRYMRIYGDVEDNLGEFYNSLTPETLAAAGLEEQAKTFEQAKTNIRTNIAQRNMEGSGLEISEMSKAELANAETKAKIRRDAPLQLADIQSNFVRGGKAPGAQPDGTNVSNAMTNLANTHLNSANQNANAANSMYSSAGNMLMTGANYYASTQTGATAGGTILDSNPQAGPSSYNPSTGLEWGVTE